MLKGVAKTVIHYRKVQAKLDAKRRRALYRSAGYGLRVMRSKIRSGKKSSQPGKSPKSHTKTLKKNIVFDVDVDAGEATVGVALLPSRKGAKPLGGKSIPQVINEGGDERLTTLAGKSIKANFKARPILDPVAETIEDNFRKNVRTSGF